MALSSELIVISLPPDDFFAPRVHHGEPLDGLPDADRPNQGEVHEEPPRSMDGEVWTVDARVAGASSVSTLVVTMAVRSAVIGPPLICGS